MSRFFTGLMTCLVLMLSQSASAAKASVSIASPLEGTKWTYSYMDSGYVIDVVQDFTTTGVMKTTMTCNFDTPVTVSVEAPVELRGFDIINRVEVVSPTVTLPDGRSCEVAIPRRVMTFSWINTFQIAVSGDTYPPYGNFAWSVF